MKPSCALTLPEDTFYKKGDIPNCPHCGKTLEDPVEDFVSFGKSTSTEECGWCYKPYTISEINEQFRIRIYVPNPIYSICFIKDKPEKNA